MEVQIQLLKDAAHIKTKNMYTQYSSPFLQEKFPEIKEENKGKFTRWVKKNMPGKSTCEAADAVMAKKLVVSAQMIKSVKQKIIKRKIVVVGFCLLLYSFW